MANRLPRKGRTDVMFRWWLQGKRLFFLWLTVALALMTDFVPLTATPAWLKPDWVFVVLCAWVLAYPRLVGIVSALWIGLFVDVAQHTLLGLHGFAMSIACYLLLRFHYRIGRANFIKQSLMIGGLLMGYQFLIFILQIRVSSVPHSPLYWCAPIVAVFIWMVGSFVSRMRR